MGIELARAYVTARGDASAVAGDFNKAKPQITSAAQGIATSVNGILATIGVGIGIAGMVAQARDWTSLAERQIQAEQRLGAAVRATGGAAGFSAEQLKMFAAARQRATTFGDEETMESMALLMTFKSVTGDVFKRTMEAAQDLSAAGFGALRSTTLQLAKAMEDPARQMTYLRRAGITLSEEQEKHIKQMQKAGDLYGAQVALMEAVEGQVKGIAEAMAQTDPGKLQQTKNVLGDMREELGTKLIPVQTEFVRLQMELTDMFGPLLVKVAQFIGGIIDIASAFRAVAPYVLGVVAALTTYVAVTKAAAIATALLQGMAGPVGWAQIAAGVAAATAAVVVIGATIDDVSRESQAATEEARRLEAGIRDVGDTRKGISALRREFESLGEVMGELAPTQQEQIKQLQRDYADAGEQLDEFNALLVEAQASSRITRHYPGYIADLQEYIDKILARRAHVDALLEAFGDFKGVAEFIKESGEELAELRPPAEKLREYRAQLDAFVKAGLMKAADAARLFNERMMESPLGKPIEQLGEMREKLAQMRAELTDAQIAKREFGRLPYVTPGQIREFGKLQEQMEQVRKRMERREAIEQLTRDMMTPLEKAREEFARLNELWAGGRGGLGAETYGRALERLREQFAPQPAQYLGAGRVGFADLGRSLQNAVLQQKDPSLKELKEQTKFLKNIDKQIGAAEKASTTATYARGD